MGAPEYGTHAYTWWEQGARDEAAARNEGMSAAAREVRDLLESLARHPSYQDTSGADLAAVLAGIYAGALTRARRRQLGWNLLRPRWKQRRRG